ncbi:MAG: D-alanyl-D-alanine carboxypeptidase [Chlamydiae bacterium]|nr:D-alanyl-D-alanine carboxypeptidase [Chlamydiota bacterium]
MRPNISKGAIDLKRTVFFILVVIFSFKAFAAVSLKCDVSSPCAVLMNSETGEVLFEKNAKKMTFPASTTKIATALYAIQKIGSRRNDMVSISSNAVAAVSSHHRRTGSHPSFRLEFGGSHMNLKTGEILPLESLIYGLLVCSGNDAANAIAEYVSGSVPKFITEMHRYLYSIGCKDTQFTNPHGLPDPHHTTTAYDLALMTAKALKDPFFRKVVSTSKYPRPKTNKQDESFLLQSNALLKPGKFYYPYATGVKTGYTVAAGSNLVASAEKGDRKLVAVVLNAEDSSARYRDCISMFEKAFNEKKVQRKLFSKEHDIFRFHVHGAKNTLEAVLEKDVVFNYYPSEERKLDAKIRWFPQNLPIKQGEIVGEVHVKNDKGNVVLVESVFAKNMVQPTLSFVVQKKIEKIGTELYRHKRTIAIGVGSSFLACAQYIFYRKKKKIKKSKIDVEQ